MQNSSACIALRAETSGSVCWRGRKKKTSTLPPSSSPHPFPCISSHPSPHPSPPPLRTHLGQALKVLIEKFAKSDSGDSSGIGNSGDRGWPLSPQDVSTWTQRAQVFGLCGALAQAMPHAQSGCATVALAQRHATRTIRDSHASVECACRALRLIHHSLPLSHRHIRAWSIAGGFVRRQSHRIVHPRMP